MTTENKEPSLESRLRAVWKRLQRKHLSAGFLALCRWIIPLFLLGMALDWLVDLPSSARIIVLAGLVGFSFYQAWKHGWQSLRGFNATRTALETEKQEGGLESLLVTAVQCAKNAPEGGSESLWKETRRKAERTAKNLEPRKIVDFRKLRTPGLIALALAGVVFVFGLVNGPMLSAGISRIFTPWISVSYPTKTIIELQTGDLVLKEGESASIGILVSGVVPDQVTLLLQTGEGDPREIKLEIQEGACEYSITSASRDFSYQVLAGDAKSAWHDVQVITAPRISDVQVKLDFPAYLERDGETVEALTLTVPQETKVHWELTLDRAIRNATLIRDGEEPLILEVTGNGRKLVLDEEVDASRGYSFSWTEKEHGFDFTSPRYYLQVASDQLPQVELTTPDSNLNALLGRELKLGVRARDDHGIGPATITYRVNLRPEKTVPLNMPIENGGGEQFLDWDYREVISDLKVGDSVSFVVEVTDKYPGGSHKARSETRRMTFLSREEYLAQIEKKKDRLLSRVRTTYRQERAAHELVRKLDPKEKSYLQSCQLEAIRQEMLRQQLKDIAAEVQALLDDLKANKVMDAAEAGTLTQVKAGLEAIAERQIARAASLLRDQTGREENLDPTSAILVVNQAARKLADLVLQRGIDFAREVFARESHMLAQEQASIRLLVIQSAGENETLAKRQEQLAEWTRHLTASLLGGMRYDKRPIAVLGLTRRIKELGASGAETKMGQAAELIRNGKTSEAALLQTEIIQPLLKSEFSMRTGAEYAAIMKFRSQLESLLQRQKELRATCEELTSADFAQTNPDLTKTQAEIQELLVTALLPPIPTPRARLLDQTFPEPPPVMKLRTEGENAMANALTRLKSGAQKEAVARQLEVEQKLSGFSELLDRSSLELSLRAQGLNALVSTATERVTLIEDFEERQIVLLEQTEEAALDEVKPVAQAEAQKFLAEEVAAFHTELRGETQGKEDALPLINRLELVMAEMNNAVTPLVASQTEDALEPQEAAADLLAEARELAAAQIDRLALLQSLYSFQRSVGVASGWMSDIVAEQNDLVEATRNAKPEDSAKLVPVMSNLRQCYTDIAPVLDLVAGRLDAGTPLLFAGTDLEDAILAIEDEDFEDATDAQEVAGESLAKVKILVDAVQRQTGYVAEIVEYLHTIQADAALIAFHQTQIREQLAGLDAKVPEALISAQEALQARAIDYGNKLKKVTGMTSFIEPEELAKAKKDPGAPLEQASFLEPGIEMKGAQESLRAGQLSEAIARMELAETSLKSSAEQLFLIITMLHGLPSIEMTSASPEELGLLLEVLALASDQRDLSRQTEAAADVKTLVVQQRELSAASAKVLRGNPPHPMLISAYTELAFTMAAMPSGNRAETRKRQEAANDALRHFIIEQALILETGLAPSSSSDDPILTEAETDDLSESVANFVSDIVAGEAPKDKKTEWQVLGNRDRAALNQNFARELPLEYRGTLKNYYERVAE